MDKQKRELSGDDVEVEDELDEGDAEIQCPELNRIGDVLICSIDEEECVRENGQDCEVFNTYKKGVEDENQ